METLIESEPAEKIRACIAAHPFFTGMDKHHIELLARSGRPLQFEAGEVIFRAGEPAIGFYLIETGTVALEGSVMEHGSVVTDLVGAGEPLGWSWLFSPYLWHFDARAVEQTQAILFESRTLHRHY